MGVSLNEVRSLFKGLESGNGSAFFTHVADDVDWIVEGTHPLGGHYHGKADFQDHTFKKLEKVLPEGTRLHVTNTSSVVIGPWLNCNRWRRRKMGCDSTTDIAG
jgi:hypothetical protein